ncbi:MAG TPA: hypothetical protein VJL81_09600 [Solirubrobacterales bacterium]|nr:hypothetical protein [Solirubrobacterales bacterium]
MSVVAVSPKADRADLAPHLAFFRPFGAAIHRLPASNREIAKSARFVAAIRRSFERLGVESHHLRADAGAPCDSFDLFAGRRHHPGGQPNFHRVGFWIDRRLYWTFFRETHKFLTQFVLCFFKFLGAVTDDFRSKIVAEGRRGELFFDGNFARFGRGSPIACSGNRNDEFPGVVIEPDAPICLAEFFFELPDQIHLRSPMLDREIRSCFR